MPHIPVLQKEVIKYLDPGPNENFIDCTFGEGGHSLAILEKTGPRGRVLGIDMFLRPGPAKERLILVRDNFANLKEIVEKNKFKSVHGILFDLGMSSWYLEDSGRGFSFQRKEPLDMRYDIREGLTAEKIVNFWSKFEIERVLRDYGEEKRAERVAQLIIELRKHRPIKNTRQLREIINRARANQDQIFQALRIAVNDELNNLKKVLPQAVEVLEPNGRLAVISFHSLEDRIVKNFFRNPLFSLLTKKPVVPDRQELRENPRSRSAKLRAIQKYEYTGFDSSHFRKN